MDVHRLFLLNDPINRDASNAAYCFSKDGYSIFTTDRKRKDKTVANMVGVKVDKAT